MHTTFQKYSFGKRLDSMLRVDFQRMFTTKLFYIMAGICLAIPILILVMTTMMEGSVNIDPNTGVETVMQGFDSAWQMIGQLGESHATGMDIMTMCNINLLYFGLAVLVGLFVSADFKSGYAKNLFTVRANKSDYIISKTVICFVAGAFMFLAFFIGTVIGGVFAGLPFALETLTTANLVMSMLSKVLLTLVFIPIFLTVSVTAKQKTWGCVAGSLAVGMLLFNMVPSVTPLSATMMNVVLCMAGGILFSFGLGAVSALVLRKKDLL